MSTLAQIDLKEIMKPLGDVIDQFITNKEERALARVKMVEAFGGFYNRFFDAQRDVIVAEAKSESWLTRNWRPLVMLMFAFIIFNNFILYPYCAAIFGWGVMIAVPAALWEIMKLGIGGYIAFRGAEKISVNLRDMFDKKRKRDD